MFRKIMWVIAPINVAASVVVLALSPKTVLAVHFGLDGRPDRWANKWTLLFMSLLPFILLIAFELYRYTTRKNHSAHKNRRVEEKVIPALGLFFVALNWIFLAAALDRTAGDQTPLGKIEILGLLVIIGLMFMVVGNYMGKVQQNYWFGVRVPWTLKNETVWKKTHRFSGLLWVGLGTTTLLWSGFYLLFPVDNQFVFIVFLAMVLLAAFVPIVYSGLYYKKLTKENIPDA